MTPPIAVQLYSLREAAARDFPSVIERLGRIGFAGVELAGLHDMAPVELRRRLADEVTESFANARARHGARIPQSLVGVRDTT